MVRHYLRLTCKTVIISVQIGRIAYLTSVYWRTDIGLCSGTVRENYPPDGQRTCSVTIPVTDQYHIGRLPVGDGLIGSATSERIAHVISISTAHGKAVALITIPVTDQYLIIDMPV